MPLGVQEGDALPSAVLSFIPPSLACALWSLLSFHTAGGRVLPLFSRETPRLRQRETWVSLLLPERLVYGGVMATEVYSSTGEAWGQARRQVALHLSC